MFGYNIESKEEIVIEESSGPMDSPWPMKSHDIRHTGRSPYNTTENSLIEKWRFNTDGWIIGGIVIDNDGVLYFGTCYDHFYAVNPDGSLKWKVYVGRAVSHAPAISEDGTIYIGSYDEHLYALNPDGTIKWKFENRYQFPSSPLIDNNGIIYICTSRFDRSRIYAVYPNGSEKWCYDIDSLILSDPAMGDDGTIYIGANDTFLYALNPNGTLKWRFKTGQKILGHPSIAEDDTIYICSFDEYLYAITPNGELEWSYNVGTGITISPSIDTDGTIYVGKNEIYAIYPNGSLKWIFNLEPNGFINYSSPAIAEDGTIYFGITYNIKHIKKGEILALNPDGTERWRKKICNFQVHSSPCIGDDGTVYIGSTSFKNKKGPYQDEGYIHAFNDFKYNVPPENPIITGETNGNIEYYYDYGFSSIDSNNNPVSFYVEWGDGTYINWTGGGRYYDDFTLSECASGEVIYLTHRYYEPGTYTIKAKARDVLGEESDWGTLTVGMPRYKPTSLLYWFLEEHPRLFPFLRQLTGLR